MKKLNTTIKLFLLTICLCSAYQNAFAQSGNIGIGTETPAAALDITSSNEGILIPRVSLTSTTDVTTIATRTVGELVYNNATVSDVTPGFYYWTGSAWERMMAASEASEDVDWYEAKTTNAPDNINDNIYTKGNVGIGTDDPKNLLHLGVRGGMQFENSEFVNLDTIADGVLFYDKNYFASDEAGGNHFINAGDGGGLALYDNDDGWGAIVSTANMQYLDMDLNSLNIGYPNTTDPGSDTAIISGAVGIGTSSPTDVLEVYSNIGGVGTTIANPRPVLKLKDTDANTWLVEMNAKNLQFTEEGVGTAITIKEANGRVGIGWNESNPTEALTVYSDQDKSAIIGKAHIGFTNYSDWAGFTHVDLSGTNGNYSLMQNSAGKTLLNSASGQEINFRLGNTTQVLMETDGDLSMEDDNIIKMHNNIYYDLDHGSQNFGDGDSYQIVSTAGKSGSSGVIPMEKNNIIKVTANGSCRLLQGTGVDPFVFRAVLKTTSSSCTSPIILKELNVVTDDSGGHEELHSFNYVDVYKVTSSTTCNYYVEFHAKNTGNETWEVDDLTFVVEIY